MAVEQDGVGTLARHLDQHQRRPAGQAHDFERRAGQRGNLRARPALEQRDGLLHMAMRRPLRIEGRRFVRDPDVIDEGRHDRIAPHLIDKAAELGGVEH